MRELAVIAKEMRKFPKKTIPIVVPHENPKVIMLEPRRRFPGAMASQSQ